MPVLRYGYQQKENIIEGERVWLRNLRTVLSIAGVRNVQSDHRSNLFPIDRYQVNTHAIQDFRLEFAQPACRFQDLAPCVHLQPFTCFPRWDGSDCMIIAGLTMRAKRLTGRRSLLRPDVPPKVEETIRQHEEQVGRIIFLVSELWAGEQTAGGNKRPKRSTRTHVRQIQPREGVR